MNREEILKAAQAEESNVGEFETAVTRKALAYGSAVGIMICCAMSAIEMLVFKKIDFGKPAIIFAIAGYANLYEGIKNKGKKKIVFGVMETIIAAIGILLYIGALFV